MAVVCIAGTSTGIGKTAVAELLLSEFPGWHAARVRVADEMTAADAAALGDLEHRVLAASACAGNDEITRLHAAGARETSLLLAQPRGLVEGVDSLVRRVPAGDHLLVEGNAWLWARPADVAVMVLGPGPSGRGLGRVKASVRELFGKIDIWAWNTRTDPASEGFFDFPLALADMGFVGHVSNKADYHHVSPRREGDPSNASFAECVRQTLARKHGRTGGGS
jgi:hypothetical protein